MARTRIFRFSTLTFANVLIPVAVLIFASGFFPYKPVLPGLATFRDGQEREIQEQAVFDRLIFMVVDALRSDFVYGYNSGFEFTQSLIRSGAAIPFTAHATPPTVTMPRVKALTTGSVPSFLDLILNFAESDTTSSLANQDTWLAQIKTKGGKLVFYGDDTWLKLFPQDFFARSDGTSSFFVSDFTEVDNNVTRHVPDELVRDDWDAMIMHYLGLDHIGHKTGPQGPNMLPKQREMDGIVQQIYRAMETQKHHAKTLLVLAGDHGMNAGGNHGGSGPGETEPALLFASPLFKSMQNRKQYECPTSPKEDTEFHYYTKVEQSDIVPVLAGLLGLPISKNSLGVFIPELGGFWNAKQSLQHLHRNSEQILNIVRAKYDPGRFEEKVTRNIAVLNNTGPISGAGHGDEEELALKWARMLYAQQNKLDVSDPQTSEMNYYAFLNHAQEAMSDTASSYDIPRMMTGIMTVSGAIVFAAISSPSLWDPSCACLFLVILRTLYGAMMFASSYVEEEQHFWYWLTPIWIALLVAKRLLNEHSKDSRMKIALAGAVLLATHRLALRWNQTGQKHAGEPDIVHTIFPNHHVLMWILILAAYVTNGIFLHNKTFEGIFMIELAVFTEVSLTFLGIVFKLNFTQADAPELVRGLATLIRAYSEPFSLVEQARAVFALLSVATFAVIGLSIYYARTRTESSTEETELPIPLAERLHHLLVLFLMTQTRAPNIPLFLILEVQRLCLGWLTSTRDPDSNVTRPSTTEIATSVLLFSNVFYFCMGGSNSISSIDLSNAYNGVADYNIAAVGILLFVSNWAGAIWWCSAAVLLMIPDAEDSIEEVVRQPDEDKDWIMVERSKLHNDAVASLKPKIEDVKPERWMDGENWLVYISSMTTFVASGLLAVMAACMALRTHLFIWTVFSPKYLYAMAWAVGWHLMVNVVFGSLMYRLAQIA